MTTSINNSINNTCGENLSITTGNLSLISATDSTDGQILINSISVLHTYNGSNSNIFVGPSAGNFTLNGIANSTLGASCLTVLTSGEYNTACGNSALSQIETGSQNTCLGANAGVNYLSSESSNIMINNNGVASESNVCRIGSGTGTGSQQLAATYISGIYGVTPSGGTNQAVIINSATGQMGSAAFPGGGFTWTNINTGQDMVSNNGYIVNGAPFSNITLTLPTVCTVGDILRITDIGPSGSYWIIAQNANNHINFDGSSTVTGTGGSLTSTTTFAAIEMVCVNSTYGIWNVISSVPSSSSFTY